MQSWQIWYVKNLSFSAVLEDLRTIDRIHKILKFLWQALKATERRKIFLMRFLDDLSTNKDAWHKVIKSVEERAEFGQLIIQGQILTLALTKWPPWCIIKLIQLTSHLFNLIPCSLVLYLKFTLALLIFIDNLIEPIPPFHRLRFVRGLLGRDLMLELRDFLRLLFGNEVQFGVEVAMEEQVVA